MADQDGAQPDEGQGAAPYEQYLEQIPEDARDAAESAFKEWDRNTNGKFQEAAEYRKRWEPYEQLGLSDVEPQTVGDLLQFARLLEEDPQAVQQWYEQYAQQAGLTEPDEEGFGEDPNIEQLIQQRLDQQLQPLASQLSELVEFRQQQAQQAARSEVDKQIASLHKEHGDFPDEILERFVGPYIESDPEHAVERAFSDYQKFVADIEKQTLSQKLGQPAGAESGGAADATPEPIGGDLRKAGALARERLRAQHAA